MMYMRCNQTIILWFELMRDGAHSRIHEVERIYDERMWRDWEMIRRDQMGRIKQSLTAIIDMI